MISHFGNQYTLSGESLFQKLGSELISLKSKRVLVFCGGSAFVTSGAKTIIDEIAQSNREFEFSYIENIPANPHLPYVRSLLKNYTEFQPDVLLAVGGGSVIDTAKIILALSNEPDDENVLHNNFSVIETKPCFIAVPTTAGSGAESTHFAVVYNGTTKYSLANARLRPDMVFLDSRLTLSCPFEITVSTGVDAICQAIESLWCTHATEESAAYAVQSLEYLVPVFFDSLDDPENLPLRQRMLEGANLSGHAINISKTTAGHALSYGLTTLFGIPHGLAVLAVLQYLIPLMNRKFEYFKDEAVLKSAFRKWGDNFPEAFSFFSTEVWKRVALKTWITSNESVREEQIDYLCKSVNAERMANHPVILDNGDICTIYTAILSHQ